MVRTQSRRELQPLVSSFLFFHKYMSIDLLTLDRLTEEPAINAF